MAQTKQTQRKLAQQTGVTSQVPQEGEANRQGSQNTYRLPVMTAPMIITITVQNTIRAGRRRRVYGGKARIYKRPAGLKRKYRPGVGALHEIRPLPA